VFGILIAAPRSGAEDPVSAPRFGLQQGLLDYTYQEPGLMRISGVLYSLGASYRQSLGSSPFWADVRGVFAFGQPTYDGAIVNLNTGVTTPVRERSHDFLSDGQTQVGVSMFEGHRVQWDVHSGLGYWFLLNKVAGVGSYTRQTQYYYWPLGTRVSVHTGPAWTWSVGLQLNVFLKGQVKSKLSEANRSLSDSEVTQRRGRGAQLHLIGEWQLEQARLFVETYYRRWDIERSTIDPQTFYEPANRTRMLGFNVGGRF